MKKERLTEIAGFVFLALSLFILLSLITYSTDDYSFYTSDPNISAHNAAGIIGAHVSFYIMLFFGYSSYSFPVIFLIWAVSLLMQRIPERLSFKVVGFLIFQSSAASVASLLAQSATKHTMGGVWGYFLSSHLETYFGFGGGLIISLACFLLSFILATEFLVFPFLSRGFVVAWEGVLHMYDSLATAWERHQARQEARTFEGKKKPKRKKKSSGKDAGLKDEEEDDDDEILDKDHPFSKVTKIKVKKYEPKVREAEDDNKQKKKKDDKEPVMPAARENRSDHKERSGESAQPGSEPDKEDQPLVAVFSEENNSEEGKSNYEFPSLNLLRVPETVKIEDDLNENSRILEGCLKDFDIDVRVTEVEQGPVITRYEILPAPGVKVSRITALQDDIALAMKAASIRIIAPIPGKAAVGIEVPNSTTSLVYLRELLEDAKIRSKARLPLIFGKDTSGKALVADLADMPHLLIAGATGSGKTVCINSVIISFLYCLSPDDLKFIMIDPKRVELAVFNALPHMLSPVVTDSKKAASVLQWVIGEMENRYKLFAHAGVRNIQSYNSRVKGEQEEFEGKEFPDRLPYIVLLIDELADLMMVAADKVEGSITRLAQLARATGIHLILATQRPSVDVITGVIKANFPARISFKVASKTDSRTVLDANGADKLLGKGDMLFLEPGRSKPIRAQATLISDQEINKVVAFVKEQRSPSYNTSVQEASSERTGPMKYEKDDLYDDALRIVLETRQASASILQRRLRVGYTRAARLIDMMEVDGIVGPHQGSKARDILVSDDAEDYSN